MNSAENSGARTRLAQVGAAHLAFVLLLAAGGLELALRLAWASTAAWERVQWVGPTVYVAAALGADYLICAALCAWQWGGTLRRGERLAPLELWLAATAHALMFGASLYCVGRGAQSRALLAGIDRLLATLLVAATLALGLLAWAAWNGRRAEGGGKPRTGIAFGLLAAGVGAAAALVWLEAG